MSSHCSTFLCKWHALWVVCSQGPLPNTCGHFWEMVWEQKSRGVVMLNRVMEKGSVSRAFTCFYVRLPVCLSQGNGLFISLNCF